MTAGGAGVDPARLMRGPLRWSRDGANWPLREHSRCVLAAGLEWHVQVYGRGPPVVLVHGTGAATHTWRDFGPLLAERWTVLAMDLPGHGFTEALRSSRASLPGMAAAVAELVRVLVPAGTGVALAVGHSAGAAILARAALDGALLPEALVSLNGALLPWRGPASVLFAPLARAMASTPLVAELFAWRAANRRVVERLVGNTGSRIDARGLDAYARLVRTPAHVAGALQMMAAWDVATLERQLPALQPRTLFLAGDGDRTVPASESRAAQAHVPGSTLAILPGLGHLAHEEAPATVVRAIVEFVERGRGER